MLTRGRQELRSWELRSALTRGAIATRLGISIPYLSQLLTGERQPSARLMLKIEQETGVPMRAWLDRIAVSETDQHARPQRKKSNICNELTQARAS